MHIENRIILIDFSSCLLSPEHQLSSHCEQRAVSLILRAGDKIGDYELLQPGEIVSKDSQHTHALQLCTSDDIEGIRINGKLVAVMLSTDLTETYKSFKVGVNSKD